MDCLWKALGFKREKHDVRKVWPVSGSFRSRCKVKSAFLIKIALKSYNRGAGTALRREEGEKTENRFPGIEGISGTACVRDPNEKKLPRRKNFKKGKEGGTHTEKSGSWGGCIQRRRKMLKPQLGQKVRDTDLQTSGGGGRKGSADGGQRAAGESRSELYKRGFCKNKGRNEGLTKQKSQIK